MPAACPGGAEAFLLSGNPLPDFAAGSESEGAPLGRGAAVFSGAPCSAERGPEALDSEATLGPFGEGTVFPSGDGTVFAFVGLLTSAAFPAYVDGLADFIAAVAGVLGVPAGANASEGGGEAVGIE